MSTERSFAAAAGKLKQLRRRMERHAPEAVERGADDILSDVRVPRLTGALAASGRVVRDGENLKLQFGGESAPYALIVHERRDLTHTTGEARYLVRAVERLQGSPGRRKKIEEDVLRPVRQSRA